MILADADIRKRLLPPLSTDASPIDWWEQRDWDKILDHLLIDPFAASNLRACTYDLRVGSEYRLLRDPHTVRLLHDGESFELGPNETALILTEEYVALPRNVMGLVVPRARRIFEGSSISATRVDPTWYGKLVIGVTNLAKSPTAIFRRDSFCTLYFTETGSVENALTRADTPFLGRTQIGKIELPNIRERRLRTRPEDVTRQDIDDVVETFGRPYDVIFGALELTRRTTFEAVERELGPKLADTAATQAIRSAFRHYQHLLTALVTGILVAGAAALITYLIKTF